MSFGFSVGDFITVLQLANKIWKEISITKICVTYLSFSASKGVSAQHMKNLKHDFDHMYFMTMPHKIGDIMPVQL